MIDINEENVSKHIHYLTENIGPRIFGTEEEKKAAGYIEQEFRRYGLETSVSPFEAEGFIPVKFEFKLTRPIESKIPCVPWMYAGTTPIQGIESELVYIRNEEELEKKAPYLAGKIVLVSIQRLEAMRAVDYKNLCGRIIQKARKAGAIGLLISNTEGIMRTHSLSPEEPEMLPVISISGKDGEKLKTDIKTHEHLLARLTLTAKRGKVESRNVIARLAGGELAHHKVILGAHMDTVIDSPGANDNASGVAALLEIARVLPKLQRQRTIEFIAFGAEEPHPYCLGSRHYVKHNISNLGEIVAALNLDMLGGSTEPGDSPSLKTTYARALHFGEEIECSRWLTEYIIKIASKNGLEIIPVRAKSMSDNVSFALEGVSAIHFRWTKDIYSHSTQDTEANMELNKVIHMAKLAGLAVWELSNDLSVNPNRE